MVAVATPAAAQLRVSVGAAEVAAEAVTPLGEVVLFTVGWPPSEWVPRVVTYTETLRDDDGDGRVSVSPTGGVPHTSIWVAADLATGAVGFGTPQDYSAPMRQMAPAEVLQRGADGAYDAVRLRGEAVELLLVRPGAGAWRMTVHDTSGTDLDRSNNGFVEAGLAAMTPVGPARPAPASFLPGDLVVAVEYRDMTLRWAVVE
jgi:hypothetical protein